MCRIVRAGARRASPVSDTLSTARGPERVKARESPLPGVGYRPRVTCPTDLATLKTLEKIPQPWLFLGLSAGFGVVAYFASGGSLQRGVIGGLAFGAAISAWMKLRRRF
jgi:hypothetical protein